MAIVERDLRSERMARNQQIVVALAGNPNSGKTSIFNSLTGGKQHVGNWPGVTVEKKEGFLIRKDASIRVIDLPGTYSLGAFSEDEAVAREFILDGSPDVVINVIDSSNLERNLYLTVQLLEMGANVVLALNMYDEARARGMQINVARLSELLGVPVIPTVATRNEGLGELVSEVVRASKAGRRKEPIRINYGREIEEAIEKLQSQALDYPGLASRYETRWLMVKLLENDEGIAGDLRDAGAGKLVEQASAISGQLTQILGDDVESIIVDRRYGFVSGLAREVVSRRQSVQERLSTSDRIDRIVTHRFFGIPVFLLAMWATFQFTFKFGDPIAGLIEDFFAWLARTSAAGLAGVGASDLVISFVADGIIGGLGSVLALIPPIFLMFFAISVLEDSGYMARAAYVMDRFMHSLGLHGKSFIPLIIGFGCNVPGIMATRTLENKQDRLITILITPFMSCSARLTVYVLFVGALFESNQGLIIFSLYLLGIVLAVLTGKLFKTIFFKAESSPFVMELPPYRMPTARSLFIHMWEKGGSFVRKAGTIIFGVVLLVWVLSNLPPGVEYASEHSVLGRLGGLIAPILQPAGFGTWEAAAALMFGILAKEVVVGTLGVVYGTGDAGLLEVIRQNWTPLSAYAFMVMTLIYVPCVATMGAIKRETNSWGWTAFSVAYSLLVGWIFAVLVYQIGSILVGL